MFSPKANMILYICNINHIAICMCNSLKCCFKHPLPYSITWGPGRCHSAVFKIEVFNALQMQFGPSKCSPKLKMKMSLEVLNIICPPQEPTSVRHCHYKKWS